MSYPLSASRLQTYQRCPQSYYFRYERGLKQPGFFGAASLGTALHQALAKVYGDWPYQQPELPLAWVQRCWQECSASLPPSQVAEGRHILEGYYHQFLAGQAVRKPLALEGRIQGHLQVENLEFTISGRYDRLDYFEDGIELIDYKSAKEMHLPDAQTIDMQIGVYFLALEQRYHQSLKQMSLLFLRTGELITYLATPAHKERVLDSVSDLAKKLQNDQDWEPITGKHCDRCGYRRYCKAVNPNPEPLPEGLKAACSTGSLQLTLSL
ncbi:MAG: PD-(D/E)XK nuclease family protein [Aphanocapsa sp. GSE-SYN-MK-11-07L]|jgi:putative RecB family exonuclease|nr:PD-(D/E)XK nuclease family protein [Aphanocapsa sp. GSE-SYN-MK-11-07L]